MTMFELDRREPPALTDGGVYVVTDGSMAGSVFVYQFGHKRPIVNLGDLYPIFGGRYELKEISAAKAAELPLGPFVPQAERASLSELLAESEDLDTIREAVCEPLHGSGYEIGAADRPTRVPLDCYVTYMDRFRFDEARDASFAGEGRDQTRFVAVSFWGSMDKLSSVPDNFAAFFIACHVIEHVPNVIRAIREVHRKLRPGGFIVLVIPDKRYIFDAGRPVTTLEHFIAEDMLSDAQSLEHHLEYSRRAEHARDWITRAAERHRRGADIHHHCFTPDSFRELLTYMNHLLRFAEAKVLEHARPERVCEFYVRIKKRDAEGTLTALSERGVPEAVSENAAALLIPVRDANAELSTRQGEHSWQPVDTEADTSWAVDRVSELERLVTELQRTLSQLRAIEQSTIWRTTWPVRAVGRRMPPSLRRLVRGAAKAAWWSATFQLRRKFADRRLLASARCKGRP